ncbi:MAG: glutamate formimidoyltransferase [Armatimonadota bacterium]
MGQQLVECVPNVSEGRNLTVIAQMADVIQNTSGVTLANIHTDPDHNRTVFTFYGPPDSVKQAAIALASKCVELIDMTKHDGMHPCLGALDVCPFVPMQNCTMVSCIELARSAANDISDTAGIPCYLYEQAAIRTDRTALPAIRKGGFSGRIGRPQQDELAPDYGPPHLHPTAGASIIGARWPLVAYNINLAGPYLNEARQMARQVRQERDTNPAIAGVRSLGLMLPSRNQAQVSMNLTQPNKTPLEGVYTYICSLARSLGVATADAELVGCLPISMLQDTLKQAFGLPCIDIGQILPIELGSTRTDEHLS